MGERPLPSQGYLRECFDYCAESGVITWRTRPISHFIDERVWKGWNTTHAGKRAGSVSPQGYWQTQIACTQHWLHRVIYKLLHNEEPMIVDHVNGDKLDNRAANLRACNVSQNARNRHHPMPQGKVRGVSLFRKKWRARIFVDGAEYHIGMFDTQKEALDARNLYVEKMHGEYGSLQSL